MLHDPLTHATSDDGPAPVPRDPRHRPVVLSVASRRPRFRHHPATRSVTSGFSLLLLSLVTLTTISAWAGWQVAVSAPCTTVLTESPAVPLGTPAAPTGPEAQAVHAPGTAAAPAPAPAPGPGPGPVTELVGEQARTPAGSGVAHEQTTLVQVATATTTTATVTQDHSAAPVTAATVAPGEPTRRTGSARAAAATTGSSDPPPVVTPPAPAPVAPHAATPRPATTTAAAPRPVTTTAPRSCDDCSAAPSSTPAPTASSPPQDPRYQHSRDEDGRHQDARHQHSRDEDGRHQDARHQDARHQDGQWSSHPRRHHRTGHDQGPAAP
jgi:hypothetical protein